MERYEGETRCKELLQEIERLKEERDAERAKHRMALGKAQQRLFEARKDAAVAAERERCADWAHRSERQMDAVRGIESGAPAPREG